MRTGRLVKAEKARDEAAAVAGSVGCEPILARLRAPSPTAVSEPAVT